MHYFAAKDTDGQWLIFLVGEIEVSNTNFQNLCDNLISKSEIRVARSLFKVICIQKG